MSELTYTFIKTGVVARDYKASAPLGVMYLSSVLRQQRDVKCHIVDTRIGNKSDEEVISILREQKPDVVGFSSFTMELPQVRSLSSRVKDEFPDVVLVIGGSHTMNDPELVLREEEPFDYAVCGEAEKTIVEFHDHLLGVRKPDDIPGLVYRNGDSVVYNGLRPFIEDLDAIPFPAWDLIDIDEYWDLPRHSVIYKRKEYVPIFTSRGCPYRCIYCHNIFGKHFRARSPEKVLDEMEMLTTDYGIKEFEIHDDTFNINKNRAVEILSGIRERGLDVTLSFPTGLRGDLLDGEYIEEFKKSGTFKISLAVETASPRLQRVIKKNINLSKIKQAITGVKNAGIYVHGLFMLGFPTETEEELHKTIEFAENSDFQTASFFRVFPFDGTELGEMAKEMGYELDRNPTSQDFFVNRYNLTEVSDEKLTYFLRLINLRFYLSLKRLFGILRLLVENITLLPYFLKLFLMRITTKNE